MQDFGWVYTTPNDPPAKCGCGRDLTVVGYVHVCTYCDFMHLWPNTGPVPA